MTAAPTAPSGRRRSIRGVAIVVIGIGISALAAWLAIRGGPRPHRAGPRPGLASGPLAIVAVALLVQLRSSGPPAGRVAAAHRSGRVGAGAAAAAGRARRLPRQRGPAGAPGRPAAGTPGRAARGDPGLGRSRLGRPRAGDRHTHPGSPRLPRRGAVGRPRLAHPRGRRRGGPGRDGADRGPDPAPGPADRRDPPSCPSDRAGCGGSIGRIASPRP